jgi:hypothetical protein
MEPAARTGRFVDQARVSMESPVLAPSVARMFPLDRLSSFVKPSVPPTATTVLERLIARDVSGPASNRASGVSAEPGGSTFASYFPRHGSSLRYPTNQTAILGACNDVFSRGRKRAGRTRSSMSVEYLHRCTRGDSPHPHCPIIHTCQYHRTRGVPI